MFVDAIDTERYSTTIIETLVNLAARHADGIIAEGVETFEQVHHLRERGIAGSGYVFAPPLPFLVPQVCWPHRPAVLKQADERRPRGPRDRAFARIAVISPNLRLIGGSPWTGADGRLNFKCARRHARGLTDAQGLLARLAPLIGAPS